MHKLFHQIFPLNLFFSFRPQNLSGDSAVSSTVDPMITKRSKVKTEAEGLRPLSPCSPVRVRNNKLNSEEFITSVFCFYSYFIIICSGKTQKFQSIFGKRPMVQNVSFFKGSLVQKVTSDTQLKEMLRNLINSNEQFSFYYYFLVTDMRHSE